MSISRLFLTLLPNVWGDAFCADSSCTESQSMLMRMTSAELLAGDVPVLPQQLGAIESNSTDRAIITQMVGQKAADMWGAGFDIIHEDFLHSHLRVYFEAEKAMMSPSTRAVLNSTQAACRGINGKKVLVAGMPRAASTSLFELVQILLYFCDEYFQPYKQTESSTYFVDDDAFNWEPFSKKGESAVVKTHTAVKDERLNWGDVIFISHREPVSLLHSQWLSFHGTETSCAGGEPIPCEDWSNCQREMERQACFYATFPQDKMKYDMSTVDLIEHPEKVIRTVALNLGFPVQPGLSTLLDHVYTMYNAVQDSIQVDNQVSHSGSKKWADAADREVQNRTFQYTKLVDVHGNPKTLSCKGWAAGGGSIASNPLMEQPNKMFDLGDEVAWAWCKA